jgi:hypothetical protein
MADFTALEWVKHPTDQTLAQNLRRNVRQKRTERGRGGHRFSMNYLKTLWGASDGIHAVLNHVDDPVWQMWYEHPEQGWMLISWHATRREAQAAAESRHPEIMDPEPTVRPGLNLVAGHPSRPGKYPIRVLCSSEHTATELEGIFDRLGFHTRRELVAAE